MSCHEIGYAISEVYPMYESKEISEPAARKILSILRNGFRFCDGNEGESLDFYEENNICGCCLKKAVPKLYNLWYLSYGGSKKISYNFHNVWDNYCDDNSPFHLVSPLLCEECAKKVLMDESKSEKAVQEAIDYLKE